MKKLFAVAALVVAPTVATLATSGVADAALVQCWKTRTTYGYSGVCDTSNGTGWKMSVQCDPNVGSNYSKTSSRHGDMAGATVNCNAGSRPISVFFFGVA